MTKSKSLSTKVLKKDLLSLLEANLEDLGGDLGQVGNGARAGRRVSFNPQTHQRAFRKDLPAAQFEEEEEEPLTEDDYEEGDSEGSDMESEEEDDNVFGADFDSLSPAEQLRLLMEPVGEDETEDDEQQEDNEEGAEDEEEMDFDDSEAEDGPESDEQGEDLDNEATIQSKPKKLRLALADDDDDEEEPKVKSTFEKHQDRLQKTISEFESENIGEKPWMLMGEVEASKRPMNSLLEHDVDFEFSSKAAPIITEEVTESLEDLIKQRIRDRAFDDVKRKTSTELQTRSKRKLADLDEEKSKKSLSQVYEDERLASTRPAEPSPTDGPVDEATKKIHSELTELFTKVCKKIDSFSQFKFAPRAHSLTDPQIKPIKFVKKATANAPLAKST